MQYTKPMIDLVLQIRKKMPAHLKPAVKLSDPDLLNHLVQQYTHLEHGALREDVAKLMALAGPSWSALLSTTGAAAFAQANRPRVMVYRGQKITT